MKYDRLERNSYDTGKIDNNRIDDFLLDNEKILWRGKPKKSAFIFESFIGMLPVALLWIAFDATFITIFISNMSEIPPMFMVFFFVFMAFHLMPVWIWISKILTARKKYENIDYCVTDKRIMIRGGFIGVNISNIFYKDINNVNLHMSISDRLFKVGDIYLSTAFSGCGKTSNGLNNTIIDIENPYEVLNLIQKIVSDIQADICYPNALRPAENVGYNTSYNPASPTGNGGGSDNDKTY